MNQSIMGTAFLLSVLLGCAPPESPPLAGARFVFVPRLGGNPDLWVFKVDPQTAAVAPVPGSPFSVGGDAYRIAAHPTGRFLYVQVGLGRKAIAGLAIDPVAGVPSPVPGSPFPLETGSRLIFAPPDGRLLYAANGGGGGTPGYAMDATTGALMPLPGSPFGTFRTTPFGGRDADLWFYAMDFTPSGRALYGFATSQPSTKLWRYTVGTDGALGSLKELVDVPFRSGAVISLVIDPSGRFVYLSWGARISAYAIDAVTGDLSSVPGSPFSQAADGNLTQLVIPPPGRFLYAVNAPFPSRLDASNVWAYAIDSASGTLVAVPGSPLLQSQALASGQGGNHTIAVDPLGQVLYAAACNSVFVLRISASGTLAHVPGSPFAMSSVTDICAYELDVAPR